jgi:hypothetical protein
MRSATEIFPKPEGKYPERKYGATRSTLFGRFYERLVARWLEENEGFKLARHPDGAPHKPRIYWKTIDPAHFDFAQEDEFRAGLDQILKSNKSHCTPDGLFGKDNNWYLWEAKNWPLYPEAGPKQQILKYLSSNPWVLAKTCVMEGQKGISGFLFSFWDMKSEIKTCIESRINRLVGNGKMRIVLTKSILDDYVQKQYNWYQEIIRQEQGNVVCFFNQLLGQDNH